MLAFIEDDLAREDVQALLAFHLADMRAGSPPGHAFALDLAELRAPGVSVWTARLGGEVAGVGALKALSDGHGEIKSMRTHPAHLRKGVAAALLEHIVEAACSRGYRRLSLETGTGAAFEPALSLYRRRGFVSGEAFADYVHSDFNQFFHLDV